MEVSGWKEIVVCVDLHIPQQSAGTAKFSETLAFRTH